LVIYLKLQMVLGKDSRFLKKFNSPSDERGENKEPENTRIRESAIHASNGDAFECENARRKELRGMMFNFKDTGNRQSGKKIRAEWGYKNDITRGGSKGSDLVACRESRYQHSSRESG